MKNTKMKFPGSKIVICPFNWILHISQDLIFLSCDSVFESCPYIPQQRGNREEADDQRIYCNSQLTSRETGVFCALREWLEKQGASLEGSQKEETDYVKERRTSSNKPVDIWQTVIYQNSVRHGLQWGLFAKGPLCEILLN